MDLVQVHTIALRILIVAGLIYATSEIVYQYQNAKFKSQQESSRQFAVKLNEELRLKSGSVIAQNNIFPLVSHTLTRLVVRDPFDTMIGYQYTTGQDKLKIQLAEERERLIHIKDIINYAQVEVEDGWFLIDVDGS